MPIVALALLLGAAVMHATWNFFAKGATNDLAFSFAFVLCSTVVYAPLAMGVMVFAEPSLQAEALAFIAVSSCFHITYYFLLTQGYRVGDLSLVYPMARGTGPVLAVIGAIIIYSERPSPLALAGTALVAAGIIVMSWPRNTDTPRVVALSLAFAVATGAVTATYTLWDKKGVSLLTPVLYSYGLDLGRTLIFAPFAVATLSGRDAVRQAWRSERNAILAIAVLSPLAYMLVLVALRIAPVSYVAPAREVSILFGALLGLRLLNEPDPARRIVGATAIVAGIFALALG
jgi:drug/metabolite transporter (DMT)-like permease